VLAEEFAVDVREGGQRLVQVLLALVFRGVEDAEEVGEVQAEVGAVRSSAIFEIEKASRSKRPVSSAKRQNSTRTRKRSSWCPR
jgi:hypothetical protein